MVAQSTSELKVGWPLRWLGGFMLVFGLAFGLPGVYLMLLGGSWFFALTGLATALCGLMIHRGQPWGLWIYIAVFAASVGWALWDVRALDLWFWPLVPRLFALFVLLWLALLLGPRMPAFANAQMARKGLRWASWLALVGIVVVFWQMFKPHGVVQTPFARAAGVAVAPATTAMGDAWHHYGRTTLGTRYAPATQITKDNLAQLKVAWTYRTGVFADHDDADQNTPAFANGIVYACTYNNQVHAIDAVSGQRKWLFEAKATAPFFKRCRGVTYYEIAASEGSACARRIALGTVDARLIALDADTGKPCADFGNAGTVDLREGMGEVKPGEYMQTSAPTVANGVIIVGGLVVDNYAVGEPSGVVRAFDSRNGALRWAWDLGRPGQRGLPPPGETYTRYTPNVWSTMAVDPTRGLVYLPTGNATPDMWRSHRRAFDDRYNSSVVALDIATGDVRWHFQTTHKDVWDYDLPSQPSLYDLPDPASGATIPALIQPTKRGQLFLLNRETGAPIAQVEERRISTEGGAPGLIDLSPTQPYSVGMPQIGGGGMSERDMWGITPLDMVFCRIGFKKLRYTGDEFTAPSVEPFFTYPGAQGGMNWGSGSIDESRGIFIINDLRLPIVTRLLPRKDVPVYDSIPGPHAPVGPQLGTPYGIMRTPQQSILGLLCSRPPYGTLSAVDLATRKLLWQRPVGTIEDLDFIGLHTGIGMPIGMPTLGGSVVTGSGLVFFGSAMDHYLRAFDVETGAELWKTRMPVGANATPISYVAANGKQYLVISAGGATYADKAHRGDYVIAYALP